MRASTWLGRYHHPLPIRSGDGFHVLHATTDDGPCVLVTPGPKASPGPARQALEQLADAHGRVVHPAVPRTRALFERDGTALVELDCPATMDGDGVLQLLSEHGVRVPYGAADSLFATLREALQAAHAVPDGGCALGSASYGNILVAPSGDVFLLGLGYNVITQRDRGILAGHTTFQAVDVAAGGAPSLESDFAALLSMVRSLTPFVELQETLKNVMRGVVSGNGVELLKRLRWFDAHVVNALPHERVTVAEAVGVSDEIRTLLGVRLDHAARREFFRQLLAREEQPADPAPEPPRVSEGQLVVGPNGGWFISPGGMRHSLAARGTLRRILLALVEKHRSAPGGTLGVWEVLAAGWPGEAPIYEAALNRVYVTMNRLRALDLRNAVEKLDDGYRIRPDITVALKT